MCIAFSLLVESGHQARSHKPRSSRSLASFITSIQSTRWFRFRGSDVPSTLALNPQRLNPKQTLTVSSAQHAETMPPSVNAL